MVVGNEYIVNLVLVHQFLNVGNLGIWLYRLRMAGHDVANGTAKEFFLPFLHGPSDVTIGHEQ